METSPDPPLLGQSVLVCYCWFCVESSDVPLNDVKWMLEVVALLPVPMEGPWSHYVSPCVFVFFRLTSLLPVWKDDLFGIGRVPGTPEALCDWFEGGVW